MGFFGTALGFLGGLIGNAQQSGNIQEQIQAQREENQKNREYNLMLARLQNAWNIEQWNRENEYNKPVNVMARLRAGGLNPDLMYSQGGMQTLKGADSPSMTAGAPSNPVDMANLANRRTLSDALGSSMMAAQIQNVKAQTKKIESETTGQDIDNSWKDLLNGATVNLTNSDIKLKGAQRQLTLKQKEEAQANINAINQELTLIEDRRQVLKMQAESMSSEAFYKSIMGQVESYLAPARYKQMEASGSLSFAETRRLTTLLVYELAGKQLDNEMLTTRNELLGKLGINIDTTTEKMNLEMDWYGLLTGSQVLANILQAAGVIMSKNGRTPSLNMR